MKYPVYQPELGGKEKEYVNDCLDSNWISSKGEYVSRFEAAFADYHDIKHAITVCNGTIALHLAMLSLGIGSGDEVIVPTFTYIAPVNSIRYVGATPIFVDSDMESWQMNVDQVKTKISPKTKAILAVHVYGHPCKLDELRALADEHGLFLIEDCAESLGSTYNNSLTGTFGDVAIFSFYGNKTITTGEGGMLMTNDSTLADRAARFRGQGLAQHREYWHDIIGYNFRMTNICAAIGLAQLERIESVLEKKVLMAEKYSSALTDKVQVQGCADNCSHSYWMVTILLPENCDRVEFRAHLSDQGIETRPAFYPVHTMPMYSQRFERYPNAEEIGRRGLNLPSYPALKDSDINFISQKVNEFFID